jgi:ketosteroid isomerase-like protein
MSAEENARLVQNACEAFGRGDMEALAEAMADDIEWVNPGVPTTTRTPERSRARRQSSAGSAVL